MTIRKFSFLASALVLAGAVFSSGAQGRVPNLDPSESEALPMVTTVAMADAPRVYCYNGIKGDPDYLYRGWICVPVTAASVRH
jgi:hypothetical protein